MVVDSELPLVIAAEDPIPGKPPGEPLAAPLASGFKVIEVKSRSLWGEIALPPLLGIAIHAAPEHIQHLGLAALPLDDEAGCRAGQLPGQGDAEVDGSAVRHGPQRVTVFTAAGVEHSDPSFFKKVGLPLGQKKAPRWVGPGYAALFVISRVGQSSNYFSGFLASRFLAGGTGEACQMFPA